jgi:hypothetical protein
MKGAEMLTLRSARLATVVFAVSCGGGADAPQAGAAAPCELLSAADVQAATGVAVQRIERAAAIGAGGTCVNFATPDGQAYLGVNRLSSAGEFTSSVAAVPKDIYPKQSPVPGLGEEAVLFSSPEGMRYLVARQGTSGVVLFPLGEGFKMSDQQLTDLARQALAQAR